MKLIKKLSIVGIHLFCAFVLIVAETEAFSMKVMKMLRDAKAMPANLLLNTGPLPDGSVHPEDVKTLKEVGRRLLG